MKDKYNAGDRVLVRAFGGKTLARVVVVDHGTVLSICRPEELEAAHREGRDPISIGFRKEYVQDERVNATPRR